MALQNVAKEFSTLQKAFQVDILGDGNPDAGINQLAAMAISLANLAHPGSGLLTPEGRLLGIGCNLLATGPLIASAILDEVLPPVRHCQDNLLSQLARLLKADKAEEARVADRRWNMNGGLKPSAGETALFSLVANDSDDGPLLGSSIDQWLEVVSSAPTEGIKDLIQRPRAFIAAPTLSHLEQQLAGAHLGQPFVAISLNHVSDAAKFGNLCPALMDGLIPAGPSGETLNARLLVTDARGLLREVATTADDKSAWLARLLWLVEGSAGPDLAPLTGDDDIVRLPNLTTRFEHAVQLGFADRLNSHKPVIYEYNFAGLQSRWVGFLTDMEKSLPGITIVARKLLASLAFGLRRLVTADRIPKGLHYTNEGVEALARLLVQRMVNHRSALLFSAVDARRLKNKRRILAKLAEDSLDARSIYHPLHLEANLCRELLEEMEADKLVERNGKNWERPQEGVIPSSTRKHLQLDI